MSEEEDIFLSNAIKTVGLDYYETSIRGQCLCLACMSNCPFERYNTTRDRPVAYDNARLTYKAWGNGHYHQWGFMSKKPSPHMRKFYGTMELRTSSTLLLIDFDCKVVY